MDFPSPRGPAHPVICDSARGHCCMQQPSSHVCSCVCVHYRVPARLQVISIHGGIETCLVGSSFAARLSSLFTAGPSICHVATARKHDAGYTGTAAFADPPRKKPIRYDVAGAGETSASGIASTYIGTITALFCHEWAATGMHAPGQWTCCRNEPAARPRLTGQLVRDTQVYSVLRTIRMTASLAGKTRPQGSGATQSISQPPSCQRNPASETCCIHHIPQGTRHGSATELPAAHHPATG